MSTVNFSVPEQVKQVFNDVFMGQNKSAIIARLMQEAVEREQRKKQGQEAYRSILERRKKAHVITEEQLRTAREHGRP